MVPSEEIDRDSVGAELLTPTIRAINTTIRGVAILVFFKYLLRVILISARPPEISKSCIEHMNWSSIYVVQQQYSMS